MHKLAIVMLLALAACGSKKQDSSSPAPCAEAAKAATDALLSGPMANAQVPADQKAAMQDKGTKLAAVLQKHCTDDKWPADVTACYKQAASMNDMKTCRAKLPADQAQQLLQEEIGVMSAR
jgi:hypothetical protein